MSAVQIAPGSGVLVPLAQLQPERPGFEPVPGFRATWRGRPFVVQAVLERTAVVYERADGERLLANKRDLLVDPADVRWQEPAIQRGGQFRRRVVEAVAAEAELQTSAVDKPAAQPRPSLEKRRRPGPNRDAIALAELLEQLPAELRDLVVQAARALVRAQVVEEELERHLAAERSILRGIHRCLGVPDGDGTAGSHAGEELPMHDNRPPIEPAVRPEAR